MWLRRKVSRVNSRSENAASRCRGRQTETDVCASHVEVSDSITDSVRESNLVVPSAEITFTCFLTCPSSARAKFHSFNSFLQSRRKHRGHRHTVLRACAVFPEPYARRSATSSCAVYRNDVCRLCRRTQFRMLCTNHIWTDLEHHHVRRTSVGSVQEHSAKRGESTRPLGLLGFFGCERDDLDPEIVHESCK